VPVQLTLFGYVLLPLCVAAILQPTWQIYLVLLTGAFGAATPLAIGALGLPPGVPPAMLFLAYVGLQYLLGAKYPGDRRAWHMLEPFLLTVAYALVSAVLLPRLFAGSFNVWPQKPIPPFDIPVALMPGAGNVTQSLYLAIEACLLVGAALFFTRATTDFARLLNAYLLSGYVVVAICGWQLANKITGIWYPERFLYSNPGWVLYPGQTVGFVPRINGPFSEPAALAFYLAGTIFCCTWLLLRGHRSRIAALLLPLAITALLLSTSTTGFTVLGIGAAMLAVYAVRGATRRVRLRIVLIALPAAALFIGIAYGLSTLSARVEESVALVMRMTLNKAEGDSFQNRTSVDLDSLAVVLHSYGFGAGWGSVRASSLIPGLLANLGIFGCALLAWFVVRLVRTVMRARRVAPSAGHLLALDGLSAAIIGHVSAGLISGSALHALDFYVLVAALVACAARVEIDVGQRRRQIQLAALARTEVAPGPVAP